VPFVARLRAAGARFADAARLAPAAARFFAAGLAVVDLGAVPVAAALVLPPLVRG
jgi:hypothetical protein